METVFPPATHTHSYVDRERLTQPLAEDDLVCCYKVQWSQTRKKQTTKTAMLSAAHQHGGLSFWKTKSERRPGTKSAFVVQKLENKKCEVGGMGVWTGAL